MPVYLVGDAKSVVWSKRPAMLLDRRDKHNAFVLIDKIFENLNYISNIFQEPHDFLIFTDSVTQMDIFLIRETSILKVTEVGFGILIKHFCGPFCAGFYYRKTSLVQLLNVAFVDRLMYQIIIF